MDKRTHSSKSAALALSLRCPFTETFMKLTALQSKTLKAFRNTKSRIYYVDKIRRLQNDKISNIGIAKLLGIIPQHVYNELSRVCKAPKENWDVPIK